MVVWFPLLLSVLVKLLIDFLYCLSTQKTLTAFVIVFYYCYVNIWPRRTVIQYLHCSRHRWDVCNNCMKCFLMSLKGFFMPYTIDKHWKIVYRIKKYIYLVSINEKVWRRIRESFLVIKPWCHHLNQIFFMKSAFIL